MITWKEIPHDGYAWICGETQIGEQLIHRYRYVSPPNWVERRLWGWTWPYKIQITRSEIEKELRGVAEMTMDSARAIEESRK